MAKQIFEVGHDFGKATYIKDVVSLDKRRRALFLCNCGNQYEATITSVKCNGSGCSKCNKMLSGNVNLKHGDANKAKEYKVWCAIKDRCYNPNCKEYRFYGGRGITMWEGWRNDYPAFLEHIGRAPTPQHSMDRIKNDVGYFPGNLRWATKKEQANNRRSNTLITYKGETNTISFFCEKYGLTQYNYCNRKGRGWTIEEIFETSTKQPSRLCLDTSTGIYYDSINEAARAKGYSKSMLNAYINGTYKNRTSIISV